MTRYYFDAIDGVEAIDEDGEDLPDFEAAKKLAGQIAAEMTPERTTHIWAGGQFRVVIRTDDGVVGSIAVTAVGDGRATAGWQ